MLLRSPSVSILLHKRQLDCSSGRCRWCSIMSLLSVSWATQILNAGIMMCPLQYTKDGFEMQIGTNHFGHFALVSDLLPSMRALVRPPPPLT